MSASIGQVIQQFGPQVTKYASKFGPQLLGLLKKGGKFAAQNPELTSQLLTMAASQTGGSKITPEQIQQLLLLANPNQESQKERKGKCEPCVRLKQKRKSGQELTDEEKRIEKEACEACEEFCKAVDQNADLKDIQLCQLLRMM